MNKQAIQKTAISRWSEDDECYLIQSPLMDSIIGVGDTVEEAQREFSNILSDAYEAYLEGKMSVADKAGRPAKNRIALNTDVKQATRDAVRHLASEFTCSQGEVIDFLVFFHTHRQTTNTQAVERDSITAPSQNQKQGSETETSFYRIVDRKTPRVGEKVSRNVYAGAAKDDAEELDLRQTVRDLQKRLQAVEKMLFKQQLPKNKTK
jgi:predicted RNase H-like HicB family nuclease